jgi:hypothetical protein
LHKCSCCTPPRTYTKAKNLFRHQRKNDATYVSVLDKRRMDYDLNPFICKTCSHPISYEKKVEGVKKYCSRQCSGKNPDSGRRTTIHNTVCLQCAKPTIGKNSKYCSATCQHIFQYNLYISEWLIGNRTGATKHSLNGHVRKYIWLKFDAKCVECGWCVPNIKTGKPFLQIDHIDGDSNNNSESNLRLLCPNCHSLTETFMALNKGNGRKNRKEWYQEVL